MENTKCTIQLYKYYFFKLWNYENTVSKWSLIIFILEYYGFYRKNAFEI